jgi:transposase
MISREKTMDIFVLQKKGLSKNAISRQTGLNWRTVNKYSRSAGDRKPYNTSNRTSQLEPYYAPIKTWLEDDCYTATWIYDRLKPLGYRGGYDQVKRYVHGIKEKLAQKAYIRFETEPGRQAQVDFSEFQMCDEFGKTVDTMYLFSMILGYSRKDYHEFIQKRDMEHFLNCHIHAFEYFGGVPTEILYDRMKNVLIREFAGKLEWNKEFYSFCLHYRFRPLVAPPYAAWVKGKVERPFHYVRENFWRGYSFRDIETANRDILEWAESRASRVHGTTHERIDVRFEREHPCLGALPAHRYDTSLKLYRTVRKDCTVACFGNWYVLPHRSVGRQVLLKVKEGSVSAYLDDELLISYLIPEGKGHFVQDERLYRALREDAEQIRRKYRWMDRAKGKGKAKRTLGITGGVSERITVDIRPIHDYMKIVEG